MYLFSQFFAALLILEIMIISGEAKNYKDNRKESQRVEEFMDYMDQLKKGAGKIVYKNNSIRSISKGILTYSDEEVKNLQKAIFVSPAHNCTTRQKHPILDKFSFFFEGIITSTLALFGVIGNTLVIIVLVLKRDTLDLHHFYRRLLILLAVWDTLFLVSNFFAFGLPLLSPEYDIYIAPEVSPKFLMPMAQISLTGSVFTMVAITLERYISCSYPYAPKREGIKINVMAIMGIVIVAIFYNITRFFEFSADHLKITEEQFMRWTGKTIEQLGDVEYQMLLKEQREKWHRKLAYTDLRKDPNYIRYYLLLTNSTVMVVIPLSSLIFMNWKIYQVLMAQLKFRSTAISIKSESVTPTEGEQNERRKEKRENTISRVLITIVVTFVCSHSFKVVVVIYECLQFFEDSQCRLYDPDFPDWVVVMIFMNHTALAFNAAVNIVIYIYKDSTFRTAFGDVFSCFGNIMGRCQTSPDDNSEGNNRANNNLANHVMQEVAIFAREQETVEIASHVVALAGQNDESSAASKV